MSRLENPVDELRNGKSVEQRLRQLEDALMLLQAFIDSEIRGESSTMYRMALQQREEVNALKAEIYGDSGNPGIKTSVTQIKSYIVLMASMTSLMFPAVTAILLKVVF